MDASRPGKTVALIAHDNCKTDLVEWAAFNRAGLTALRLVATATTGSLLERELDLEVHRVQSGPLGGDMQVGSLVTRAPSTC